MTETVISVEHLSKRYRLGVIGTGTFRDDMKVWFARVRGKPNPLTKIGETDHGNREGDILWALKDIDFTVQRGEALGIIGRNGAGKSTLLKILSRVTTPTEGRVRVKGRIASLLEVGTGFHPELTGRENIYLNGAILGMTRAEVNRKFDEIVDFSGVERFIDTPVKRYSSGMYVRLAFAVAAHLEPEILIVDEVLAVGDAEFQKKCLGKMGDVASGGRTVLFVSHNMSAILSLCQNSMLLDHGSILRKGNSQEVVAEYLSSKEYVCEITKPAERKRGKLSIERIRLLKNGELAYSFTNSETMTLQIEVDVRVSIDEAQLAFEFYNDTEVCIFCSTQHDADMMKPSLAKGRYIFNCPIPLSSLREGKYLIRVSSSVPGVEILDVVEQALVFHIHDDSSPLIKLGAGRRGLTLPILKWNIEGPI